MKRLLLFISIVFVFSVNSCTAGAIVFENQIETAVAETQTATAWTAVPTLTPNPNTAYLIGLLNSDLSTASPLGWTLDAEYHIIDISFSNSPHGVIFGVDVGCICMNSEKCCTPERTFVVVAESMKRNWYVVSPQVSGSIAEILVSCSDQQSKQKIGAMKASWEDMHGYLQGYISGYQLGVRVTRITTP